MVFITKLKANGSLDKRRARLVAKGYHQEEGVDFLETYIPLVRTTIIRLVLDVATAKDWKLTQLYVKMRFYMVNCMKNCL